MPNAEFEGSDDGRGYGNYTFLVKQAQPSHARGKTQMGITRVRPIWVTILSS